ncbi:DEAD/DEAH box helicase family protein [Spongorhabdus nitratireducens]
MEVEETGAGSALLTAGGYNDPLLPKLISAINRAREIEISVAFIRMSGLKLLFDALSDAIERGTVLKVLTSDYLDVTDSQALRELMLLKERGADIRIYQSDGQQSFHMKAYIFIHTHDHETVEGCAFVGSSNISKAALVSGHEWNLKLQCKGKSEHRDVQQFNHIRRQFSDIFSHSQVQLLTHGWIDDYCARRRSVKLVAVEDGVEPEPPSPSEIQLDALRALQQTREAGNQRGLVVLATGLGKTWLAAFDSEQCRVQRVLFVAHREEILLQAQKTFSRIRKDARTGFYNGKIKSGDADIIFASVQTLGRQQHLQQFGADDFDYIVVDEFHHADAVTYRNILKYFQPKFMLGLTATPERTDQADILSLCDNNLVFECNLVAGINAGLLSPFHYFGIADKHIDYDEIPWRNGRFDPESLENAFASYKRAHHALTHWEHKRQQRTLAFCISKRHADFMAGVFRRAGYRAAAVYSDSQIRRNEALSQLEQGRLDILFSVDLFNEGTDLPSIDTVLMLRPTESKILFLQQLGRGLRLHEGKSHLVVIDFIGNHKSFLTNPVALLNEHSGRQVVQNIIQGAFNLAAGCYVDYDPEAIDFLARIARKQNASISDEYQSLKTLSGRRPTATEFYSYLQETVTDFKKVRDKHGSWFGLVKSEGDLDIQEAELVEQFSSFLLDVVEKTAMSKCFKMILLEAFLELDGFAIPPTTNALAAKSWQVLKRRPQLFQSELPEKQANLESGEDKEWHRYWNGNPVKAFLKSAPDYFEERDGRFTCTLPISADQRNVMHRLVQELVDLRLEQYSSRIRK